MRDELILNNDNLIYFVLGKMGLYDKREIYYDIGLIGLVKAGNTFDPTRGFKFSTYACNSIKTELLRYLKSESRDKRKSNHNTISLDKVVYDDGNNEITLGDTLKSDVDIEKELIKKEQKELLYKALSELKEEELFVINHYYGLSGCELLKQVDIANRLSTSQTQISRIKNKTIEKLKNIIKEDKWIKS